MEVILAIVIGALYAGGIYMLLRRSLVKLLIGLALLAHAANVLIFTAAGLGSSYPPVIPSGASEFAGSYSDPLPQALVLTAIVIGLGVIAFALSLTFQVYKSTGTDDLDGIRSAEE